MNTPTHIVLSIAALTRSSESEVQEPPAKRPTYLLPATIGAILPDAPMFVFYGIEKLVVGSTEHDIWSTRYFLPAWQDLFDAVNSIAICVIGLLIAWRLGRTQWMVLFGSMLLHFACDLPLHHDDGHRHFWPLTDWRYESPVSYWDPNHFGMFIVPSETLLFLVCYALSMRKHKQLTTRIGLSTLAVIYLLMTAMYVLVMSTWA